LKAIREQQAGGKAGRNKTFDEIKRTDEKLKSLIAEQKAARSRTPFKSVEDLDKEISRLEKQVDGGMMNWLMRRRHWPRSPTSANNARDLLASTMHKRTSTRLRRSLQAYGPHSTIRVEGAFG